MVIFFEGEECGFWDGIYGSVGDEESGLWGLPVGEVSGVEDFSVRVHGIRG